MLKSGSTLESLSSNDLLSFLHVTCYVTLQITRQMSRHDIDPCCSVSSTSWRGGDISSSSPSAGLLNGTERMNGWQAKWADRQTDTHIQTHTDRHTCTKRQSYTEEHTHTCTHIQIYSSICTLKVDKNHRYDSQVAPDCDLNQQCECFLYNLLSYVQCTHVQQAVESSMSQPHLHSGLNIEL